jgi:UDP-N-acetylmuramoylalanine--D-glutamate ligase
VRASFGSSLPGALDEFGIAHDGGLRWLAYAVAGDDPPPTRRRPQPVTIVVKRMMPADALRIRGAHNHANALAALALARALGAPIPSMLHALRDFEGEPHRCELVAVLDDVEYYDDSKGTNVGATVAALVGAGQALPADRGRRRQGSGLFAAGRARARPRPCGAPDRP